MYSLPNDYRFTVLTLIKCTPAHGCTTAGSRRAGTGGKFVVGYDNYFTFVAWSANGMANGEGGVKCVGWFIWDAGKGCVPYLFSIVRLVHWLVEKIIPFDCSIHCATNNPPFLSFAISLVPGIYPTYDAVFSTSSSTCIKSPRITFPSGISN